MAWIVRPDSFNDELLGSEVTFRYKVDLTFISDLHKSSHPFGEQTTCLARSLDCEVKQKNRFPSVLFWSSQNI